LLGFEVCFFLQHPEAARGAMAWAGPARAVPVPEAIRTFVVAAQSFAQGDGPVRARQVADRLGIPEPAALAMLAELEGRAYLARVAASTEAWLPARDPGRVRVADLWRALGGAMGSSEGDGLGRLLSSAAEATVRAMGDITVRDLLDSVPAPDADPAARPAPADAAGPA